jgi:hypothetical protein
MVDALASGDEAVRARSEKSQATWQEARQALGDRRPAAAESGEWDRFWECHIEPDWLLIWDETEEMLTPGSHWNPRRSLRMIRARRMR